MNPAILRSLIVSSLLTLGLGSCGLQKASSGPEPTRFLRSTGTDMSQRIDRLPFAHSWRDPKVDITKYKNIVVRPVTASFLDSKAWEESKSKYVPNKRTYVRRVNTLSRYWTKSLNKSFSSPICVFYKTTDTGRPNTLVLEVALTEVRFDPAGPKPADAPLPTGNVASVLTGLPYCAFEARVTDAATGALVSTAADKRGPQIKVLDPERETTSKPNESICDEWSRQLMESSNIEIFPKVKRSWFSLF